MLRFRMTSFVRSWWLRLTRDLGFWTRKRGAIATGRWTSLIEVVWLLKARDTLVLRSWSYWKGIWSHFNDTIMINQIINYKTYIIICKVVFGSMSFSIGLLRLLRFISSFCIVFHFHPELSTFWRSMYLFRRIFSLVLTLIFRFNMNFPSVDFLDFGFMRLVFSFIQRLRKFFCFQSWGLCFLFTNRSPNTHIYLFPWWKPLQFYAAIL